MSDWYPAHEETKTLDFRYIRFFNGTKRLQQKVVIRDGIEKPKITVEWRDIEEISYRDA